MNSKIIKFNATTNRRPSPEGETVKASESKLDVFDAHLMGSNSDSKRGKGSAQVDMLDFSTPKQEER